MFVASFVAINERSQKFMCSLVDLPLIAVHKTRSTKTLGSPTELYYIQGDGNCLFRSLSYALTGRQIYHNIIRHKIINHMKDIESLLRPHMNGSLKDYLSCTNMANKTTWGTDIEILAASSMLQTDIFVYTQVGTVYKWNRFSTSMLDGSLPRNKCAIYINHTGGVHYDVVLDVCSDISDVKCANYINHTGGVHYDVLDACSVISDDKNISAVLDFIPVNDSSQKFMCSLVDLPLIAVHKTRSTKTLGSPTELYHIQGDGNCLFRSLSYALTGRQIYHNIIRHKIINHMKDIESLLRPHINGSLEDYLSCTNMTNKTTWGTDIEILAVSSMLQTDIFVYTQVGTVYKWNRFSTSMLDGSLPRNKCAIYINHTGGVHYDVVVDVCSDISDVEMNYCSQQSSKRKNDQTEENSNKKKCMHGIGKRPAFKAKIKYNTRLDNKQCDQPNNSERHINYSHKQKNDDPIMLQPKVKKSIKNYKTWN